MLSFIISIFVSAFLLFQVQPIIARYILPWYGSTPAVWTTCMLFFQVGLLFGYAYAHLLTKIAKPKHQALIHLILLFLSILSLPITPDDSWKPMAGQSPFMSIITLLITTVGIPYFLIASSSPLFQHWFSRIYPDRSPYRLYALSNAGSLLGLFTYPFLVEPLLTLKDQTLSWTVGYGFYIVACLWCAFFLFRMTSHKSKKLIERKKEEKVAFEWVLWLLLAACGSTLFLAVTNQMCQDIAVVPFLWIIPLSIYLLSYIFCFNNPRWYRRSFWIPVLVVVMFPFVYLLTRDPDIRLQILIYCVVLFSCCVICHGELYRLKPPNSRLTFFYLIITLGGAFGGFLVNIAAPLTLKGYWELHGSLIFTVVLAGICIFVRRNGKVKTPFPRKRAILWVAAVILLAYVLGTDILEKQKGSLTIRRNFYGILRVFEEEKGTKEHRYSLYHGNVEHGNQYLNCPERPTTYYGYESSIGIAIREHPERSQGLRVGVVGLGAGVIAAYSRQVDSFVFYEINPQVEAIARKYFSYLEKCKGKVDVVIGDARISLERELLNQGPLRYDILALDAFSGDAIPIHLLTREAFDLYWKHLKSDGILAIHISNAYLDLKPVVKALARESGMRTILIEDDGNYFTEDGNDWVLVTSNKNFLLKESVSSKISPWGPNSKQVFWTDNYSNLLSVLK